jgi:hypothetical protein
MIKELAKEACALIGKYRDKHVVIDNWEYRVQALLIAVAQLQHADNMPSMPECQCGNESVPFCTRCGRIVIPAHLG